ncbi:MAG TPA: glycosyltransferase family 4 protein [Terriglobales bacterium]|nr:glycosyltransferase family 4 protein [Terriglobales bacterium]
MRILTAHNYYHHPGGEDVVFAQETSLLQQHGHEAFSYERSNDELQSENLIPRVLGAAASVWSRATYSQFSEVLRRVSPDVVHVHNTFLAMSPSVFSACQDARIPVVYTVHNYRLLCANSAFYRDGRPCEKCASGNKWHAIANACYRSSRLATGVAVSTVAYNWHRGTWTHAIDRYIAPSHFLREKLISAGLPAERIVVKPHFVDPDPGVATRRDQYAVFVGRLSPEKGVNEMLKAWEQLDDVPLKIVGDGPERVELEVLCREKKLNVQFTGYLSRTEALEHLQRARLLIFPSITYESFGMGIVEAYACGIPVIASDHGAMRELVEDGHTGLRFRPTDPDDLARCIRKLWSDQELLERCGDNARQEFERKYTAEANYQALMGIYAGVLSARRLPVSLPVPAVA